MSNSGALTWTTSLRRAPSRGYCYGKPLFQLPAAREDATSVQLVLALKFELKLDPAHPYLAERRLSPALIREFGLGYCARGVMAGRICIPIHDAVGQRVAYAGRWPGDDVPEDEEHYKLPPKFHKRAVLYNLHRVPPGEHIILVEGYWSAIRLHALGFPVAALMG